MKNGANCHHPQQIRYQVFIKFEAALQPNVITFVITSAPRLDRLSDELRLPPVNIAGGTVWFMLRCTSGMSVGLPGQDLHNRLQRRCYGNPRRGALQPFYLVLSASTSKAHLAAATPINR
jgi:hypothetical protein